MIRPPIGELTTTDYKRRMRVNLSDQSIDALAEIISGGPANDVDMPIGLYRQGWKIVAWFKAFGVPVELGKESRVAATKTAISTASFIGEDLLKQIVEKAADPRDFINDPERHGRVIEYLNKHLAYDNLRLEVDGRKMRLVEESISPVVANALAVAATDINFDTVNRDLDRALRSISSDPEMAVTSACATVESVCRSVLVELAVPLPAKQDLSGLYRALCGPLGLAPSKEGVAPEIANDVQNVLSGLVTTVQSIGALRTHSGGAHGKERGFKRIDARIARLAVHSASAVALFIIETWQLRYPGRSLKNGPPA